MPDFGENPEDFIQRWAANPRLQKAQGTIFHKLRAAARPDNEASKPGMSRGYLDAVGSLVEHGDFQIFVVEHDWAAAFDGAVEAGIGLADVKLPYPISIFEFSVSGLRLCVAAVQGDLVQPRLFAFVQLPYAWVNLNLAGIQMVLLNKLVTEQLRAIAIALDAQIATTEVVRAPNRLNQSRVKSGKPPISDYHVVKLARRTRPVPLPEFHLSEERRGVRLHFRRGHWRHFEAHKTWINWTLVGDPDLGFISKHYAL